MPLKLPLRVERSLAGRLLATLVFSGLALALTVVLRTHVDRTIFIFFWVSVILSAWYAGFWSALFAVLFAIVAVNYFLLEPRGTLELRNPGNFISIGIFGGLALFVSWIGERMRTAERDAMEHARQREEQALELETQMEENQTLTEELEATLQESDQARTAAESANRAKSEFLAVMSHELRTPLNAVVGYTDLLQTEVAGPLTDAQKNHLSRIRASSWHLLELIQDVLSFARIEAGRETLRVADVELNEVTQEVVSYIERAAHDKGLRVEADVASDPMIIITDPGKLRQILLNLLSNAVKFTDRGGLGIRLKPNGDGVEFEVWDTGRGIDNADQEMVFEPFTQVDQTSTREKGGVGLGLPVSRQLADMLGGTLTLVSERGKGTTFSLWLPKQVRVS